MQKKPAKRGRPRALVETEQVAVRLPRFMVDRFRKGRHGLSREIQERLARSMHFDQVEPHLRVLCGQIEQLAKAVHRAFGQEWHADQRAHRTFIETVRLLLNDLERQPPSERKATVKAEPTHAAELIYNHFVATTRDAHEGRVEFRPSLRQILEGSND